MAKGAIAKTNVVKKIQEAFGVDFVGEFDKLRSNRIFKELGL